MKRDFYCFINYSAVICSAPITSIFSIVSVISTLVFSIMLLF